MSEQKIWNNFLNGCKEYREELIFFVVAVGLTCVVQLIGCNEVAFTYTPPPNCKDFDMEGLEDASCESVYPGILTNPGEASGGGNGSGNNNGMGLPSPNTPGGGSKGIPQSRPGPAYTQFSNTYSMGVVDIIFVIDNSRSMHVEQKNIANQFDQFLNNIRYLDYRIALMTVDISDSPNNQNRTYQDGRFIKFKNGQTYLSNEASIFKHRKNIELFKQAVQRPESIDCMEPGRADECPDDERAICALNKSFGITSQLDFFRKTSHLMIIILSDEDEGSSKEFRDHMWDLERMDYNLTRCDNPDTFYTNVAKIVGIHNGVSVHAIIIPPGDEACLKEQYDSSGQGYYGKEYKKFAEPPRHIMEKYPFIESGQVLSICDRSFDAQLGRISEYLKDPLPITLPCKPSKVKYVRLVDGDTTKDIRYELNGKNLKILEDQVSLSARVRTTILCPRGR